MGFCLNQPLHTEEQWRGAGHYQGGDDVFICSDTDGYSCTMGDTVFRVFIMGVQVSERKGKFNQFKPISNSKLIVHSVEAARVQE
jgi:hypothetical protein